MNQIPGSFVTVNSSGTVELRIVNEGVVCLFGTNAQSAFLNGDHIQVHHRDRKISIYKIGTGGRVVSGPYYGGFTT